MIRYKKTACGGSPCRRFHYTILSQKVQWEKKHFIPCFLTERKNDRILQNAQQSVPHKCLFCEIFQIGQMLLDNAK